jgi:hypothetical protein
MADRNGEMNGARAAKGRAALAPYLSGPLQAAAAEAVIDLLTNVGHYLRDEGMPTASVGTLLDGCCRVAVDHFHFEVRPGNPARVRITLEQWEKRRRAIG